MGCCPTDEDAPRRPFATSLWLYVASAFGIQLARAHNGRVNGTVLWGNLHLLFWLSLFPVTTAWLAQTTFARTPVIVYGINLLLAAVGYYVLQMAIFHVEGDSGLRQALGRDLKGKVSPVLYMSGIPLAFVTPWLAVLVFTSVAIMWLVPDQRVERYIAARESSTA